MKKKFYTWEECMQLREVKVKKHFIHSIIMRKLPLNNLILHYFHALNTHNTYFSFFLITKSTQLQSLKKLNHPNIVKLREVRNYFETVTFSFLLLSNFSLQ
jgi:hypothetical protein